MCQFFIVAFNPHCSLIIFLFFSGSLLFFIMRHVISFGWLLLSFPAVRVILDALFCDVFHMENGKIKKLTTYQMNKYELIWIIKNQNFL